MAEKKKEILNELSTDERREILKELLNTGIVGETWPKFTHLIGFVKDKDGQVIYENCYDSKDHSHHAEIKMLHDYEFLKMVKTGNVNITLTSNYSPCSNCASELEKFYVENNDFIKSCTIRFSFVYYKDILANRVGLRNLNKAGITLEAMTEDSWSEVSQWLGFSWKELADEIEVRKRDDDTRKTLTEVLSEDPEERQEDGAGEDSDIEEFIQKMSKLIK